MKEYFCVITMTKDTTQAIHGTTVHMIMTVSEQDTAQGLYKEVVKRCEEIRPHLKGGVVVFYSATPNRLL